MLLICYIVFDIVNGVYPLNEINTRKAGESFSYKLTAYYNKNTKITLFYFQRMVTKIAMISLGSFTFTIII